MTHFKTSGHTHTTPAAVRMPVLFVGHGSPLHALGGSPWSETLAALGQCLPRPKAILAISAHWLTAGTSVLASAQPKTIHDFYGFPEELYALRYPAPGAMELAEHIASHILCKYKVTKDSSWGLDHGSWAVLRHMYPEATIPVTQLSLNTELSNLREHLALGEALRALRDEGVLLVCSGNITHNLRDLQREENATPVSWAVEFDALIKDALLMRDLPSLLAEHPEKHALWRKAHPSLEHYLPLLYAVGASLPEEKPSFPFEEILFGTLSMRVVMYGA